MEQGLGVLPENLCLILFLKGAFHDLFYQVGRSPYAMTVNISASRLLFAVIGYCMDVKNLRRKNIPFPAKRQGQRRV